MNSLPALLAVDPVPWARSQMAFTLAFHIILVPLGVSWAFMALVANYRAIKKHDADALLLAQRWSKYMAVTFAVGAVTGTVLTFEFGLLWPRFMGRFGEAFGIPFAVEGLFFFAEAIFVGIYIYGWKRMKPWPHFWTGVPIVIAGIGGTASVVAANSWMNEPAGFTLNSAGNVVSTDPWAVIFNKRDALRGRAHAGCGLPRRRVPDRVGVRGRHAPRTARPLPPAWVPDPVHRRRDRGAGPDAGRATRSPVGCTTTNPPSSRRSSSSRKRRPTSPRRSSGISTRKTRSRAGSRSRASRRSCRIPRPARARRCRVWMQSRRVSGRRSKRSTSSTSRGTSWSASPRCCSCCRCGTRSRGCSGATSPKRACSSGSPRAPASLSVVALEAGWVVTEVGRQPWIVHGYMKVEQAATSNQGVWAMFLIVLALYTGVGVTLILILRKMSRRFRVGGEEIDVGGPYSPREPVVQPVDDEVGVR